MSALQKVRGRRHLGLGHGRENTKQKSGPGRKGDRYRAGGKMLGEGRPCLTQCQGGEFERTRVGRFLCTGGSDSAGVSVRWNVRVQAVAGLCHQG